MRVEHHFNEWRDHPFAPHFVARSRPSAYMKWVVMEYINILIAYGDYCSTRYQASPRAGHKSFG